MAENKLIGRNYALLDLVAKVSGRARYTEDFEPRACGTVINPRSLLAQIKGGSCLGIAHALQQKLVYDPHYGVSLAHRWLRAHL
jgi:CO/xanthine dehydrogenase Mo-binding subunit